MPCRKWPVMTEAPGGQISPRMIFPRSVLECPRCLRFYSNDSSPPKTLPLVHPEEALARLFSRRFLNLKDLHSECCFDPRVSWIK